MNINILHRKSIENGQIVKLKWNSTSAWLIKQFTRNSDDPLDSTVERFDEAKGKKESESESKSESESEKETMKTEKFNPSQ